MKRRSPAVLLFFGGALACAMSVERLQPLERRFHANLPTAEDRAAYLKQDSAHRKALLERTGLWARWSALTEREREAAARGQVAAGDHEFAAFMAWGPPADTQCSHGDARTVCFHTFIRCTSGPRAGRYAMSNLECDGTSSEVKIAVERELITQIKALN
jgi:hypothetical protein